MILFVTDQVAGAEYIYPLLKSYIAEGISSWTIISSVRSAPFFEAKNIRHQTLENNQTAAARALLNKYKPDHIIASASGNSAIERAFVSAAKVRRIRCTQFVDHWVNLSQRFKVVGPKGANWLLPDTILTLDTHSKHAMELDGIPAAIIEVIGQPYFEEKMGHHVPQIDAERPKKLLLITQPVRKFYGESLGYTEDTFFEIALDSFASVRDSDFSADVLVHPSEDMGYYHKRLTNFLSHIRVYQSRQPPLENYSHALGMFSSVMVHTLLAGVNTASLQPGAVGADMCHLSKFGFISRYEFVEEISDFLNSSDRKQDISNMRAAFSDSLTRLKAFLVRVESAPRPEST
jgi:hypothetical protein